MLPKDEVDYTRKRVNEIIRDYAYDKDESYVYITLYFEKSNGESQHKRLLIGKPSAKTPDRYRDEPHGYSDGLVGIETLFCTLDEVLLPEITWKTSNGEVWDGTPLEEIRKRKKESWVQA